MLGEGFEFRAVEMQRSIAEYVSGASSLLWKFVRQKSSVKKYQTIFQVKKQLKKVIRITQTAKHGRK